MTLYDLTNTFFEGEAADQPKARRGHSKEKRTDCPLLTLGLVLDGGLRAPLRSVCGQCRRRQDAWADAGGSAGAQGRLVVMDAGIATEDNVAWLRENGYQYLV